MTNLRMSPRQYRQKLKQLLGYASPILVQEYADAWQAEQQAMAANASTAEPEPCSTKHCRLGDRECPSYHGCQDTCRVTSKRITVMTACPE